MEWKLKWGKAECRESMWSLSAALYAPMLEHWLTLFKPSQFIIVSSQTYFKQPQKVVAEVADALVIPAQANSDAVTSAVESADLNNRASHPTLEQESPELIQAVRNFYQPHVLRLKELCYSHRLTSDARMKIIGQFPWMEEY